MVGDERQWKTPHYSHELSKSARTGPIDQKRKFLQAPLPEILSALEASIRAAMELCKALQTTANSKSVAPVKIVDPNWKADVSEFLLDRTEPSLGSVPAGPIYKLYVSWAHARNRKHVSPKLFSRAMQEAGFQRMKRSSFHYFGLSLKAEVEEPSPRPSFWDARGPSTL
jgi:hypothetical protein